MLHTALSDYYPTRELEYAIYHWADGTAGAQTAAARLEAESMAVTLIDLGRGTLLQAGSLESFILLKPFMGDSVTPFIAVLRKEWINESAPTGGYHEVSQHYSIIKLRRNPTGVYHYDFT